MRRRVAGTAIWDVSPAGASEYASLIHALHVLPVWLPELVQVETIFRAGSQPEAVIFRAIVAQVFSAKLGHDGGIETPPSEAYFWCSSGRCRGLHCQADCPHSQTQVEWVAGDTVDALYDQDDRPLDRPVGLAQAAELGKREDRVYVCWVVWIGADAAR